MQPHEKLEDWFRRLNEDRYRASLHLHQAQRGIVPPCHVVTEHRGIVIFGDLYDRDRFVAAEIAAGGTTDEADWIWESHFAPLAERDVLYGKWYSVVVPDGESGSRHRIELWPLSDSAYQGAADMQWQVSALRSADWREVSAALTQRDAHRLMVLG